LIFYALRGQKAIPSTSLAKSSISPTQANDIVQLFAYVLNDLAGGDQLVATAPPRRPTGDLVPAMSRDGIRKRTCISQSKMTIRNRAQFIGDRCDSPDRLD
jgi:hypothetical protein